MLAPVENRALCVLLPPLRPTEPCREPEKPVPSGLEENSQTLDFSSHAKGTARITVRTTPGYGTTTGNYSITVNAYPVSGNGATPDASVNTSP